MIEKLIDNLEQMVNLLKITRKDLVLENNIIALEQYYQKVGELLELLKDKSDARIQEREEKLQGVYCIQLDKYYDSTKAAAREFDVIPNAIYSSIRQNSKLFGKYNFTYI